MNEQLEILADAACGICIPQHFADACYPEKWGIPQASIDVLLNGPDNPEYWDAWDWVLDMASREHNGHTWTLHQDGDLFAVRDDVDVDQLFG